LTGEPQPGAEPQADDERRVDLVFEGGGVKGIGLAGAFDYLSEQRFEPQRVAGTSAGAITAALVAAGWRGEELKQLVLEKVRFKEFADGGHWPLAQGIEMLRHKGLHPGRYFEAWMRERLEEKGITKFGQLRDPIGDAQDPTQPHYRLQVIASDLTKERMLVLPRDAREHLGVEPDELDIARAVRMSMSIPIFFDPVVHQNPTNADDEHVIVDGGLLSNFPVWLFDCPPDRPPEWPTFGLLLVAPGQRDPLVPTGPNGHGEHSKGSIAGFLLSIGRTMMEAHDRLYVEQANYARTIPIDTLGVKTTQFSIDDDSGLKQRLFQSGRDAAEEFLKTWDFKAYIETFRRGPLESRRDRVVRSMKGRAG
jgi:NTE family protein